MERSATVERVMQSKPTLEGAGVHLRRAFGPNEVPLLDPFLLLDDFHSENPADYLAGFPWHPHRGIETVTYMIGGTVEHGDSIGNKGAIDSGDVQWMTAGSGIIHQEMPRASKGLFQGFQLWVNLPASSKMMSPRYRGIVSDQIPFVKPKRGSEIRVIAGDLEGTVGPVKDLVVDAEYLDVKLLPDKELDLRIRDGFRGFAYAFEGSGVLGKGESTHIKREYLAVFREDGEVNIRAGPEGLRFLLVSGRPIREPVAWGGPIVMNTREELDLAFEEYWRGTFIKHH